MKIAIFDALLYEFADLKIDAYEAKSGLDSIHAHKQAGTCRAEICKAYCEAFYDAQYRASSERWEASCIEWIKRSTHAEEHLKPAVARVKLANEEGNPILSAWLIDAEQFLDDMRKRDEDKRRT